MNASLHAYDRNIRHITENESALMTGNRRNRKTINIMIIQCRYNMDPGGIVAKSRTKNKCNLRSEIDF